MQTRDHKKLAEMFASEMSRKRIPYILISVRKHLFMGI